MAQIYARVKPVRTVGFRRVVSDRNLFENFPLGDLVLLEYNSGTLLSGDEWFHLDLFSEKGYFPEFLRDELHPANVPNLAKDEFQSIAFLLADQVGGEFIQRVLPSSVIRQPRLKFGDAALLEPAERQIEIRPLPDAIYLREMDRLIFRDLARISPIFPGIDDLYRAATNDEVEDFLSKDFVRVRDFDIRTVSKPNRHRIAMALETLGEMGDDRRERTLKYMEEYSQYGLRVEDGRFIVSSDEDVKNLVWGIEERYYTTEASLEPRVANSIQKLRGTAGE